MKNSDKPHYRIPDELKQEAEQLRYDAQHRPVDRLGFSYDDTGPTPPVQGPTTGADQHAPPQRGTLDPYHRGDPGEASPDGSPARPKAPPVHQATEDGRLYVPAEHDDETTAKPAAPKTD